MERETSRNDTTTMVRSHVNSIAVLLLSILWDMTGRKLPASNRDAERK